MALFDPLAASYDAWYETPLGRLVDALEREIVFGLASPRPGELALDVGCGTGHYALELARRGVKVVGGDPSPAMLAQAVTKAPGLPLCLAGLPHLPFPHNTFDLVLAVAVLEFVADPVFALAEARRVLRPGGRLVVGALNRRSLWYWLRWRRRGLYAQANITTPEELCRLLAAVGPVEWRSAVFFPPWAWLARTGGWRLWESIGRWLFGPWGAFVAAKAVKET